MNYYYKVLHFDVCRKSLTIVARLLILDVLVVLAIFMKHLICTPRFLEKIHKYREEKEITPFPLIQSIGTWLREDEPSEKYNVDWWSFILKHIFITVFNQSKTKTLLYFGNKEKVFKRVVKASEQLVPTISMFFQWYLLALFSKILGKLRK